MSSLSPSVNLLIIDLGCALESARDPFAGVGSAFEIGSALQRAALHIPHMEEGQGTRAGMLWRAVYHATAIALEDKLGLSVPTGELWIGARDMCPRTLLALADELDDDAVATEGDSVHDLPAWMRTIARRYRRRAKLARGGWAAMRANEEKKRGESR